MTKFAKTLITGLILTMGVAGAAHAADNTFSVSLKIDNSVSAEQNYLALQKQVEAACGQEITRAGFRKTESVAGLKRKCEKRILTNAVKATNSLNLIALHNEAWGVKIKTRQFAKK